VAGGGGVIAAGDADDLSALVEGLIGITILPV
jgi:hypothetical protein